MRSSFEHWHARSTPTLALIVAFWIPPSIASQLVNVPTCQLFKVAEFPITMIDDEAPAVEARINGQAVKMLVYSGSVTSLTRPGARMLGLRLRPATYPVVSACGVEIVNSAKVRELTIGKFTGEAGFLVAGSRRISDADDSVVGMLGDDFFKPYDVEFDFSHQTMQLFVPSDCPGDQVVYWNRPYSVVPIIHNRTGEEEVRIHVLLNGRQVVAELSSGSLVTYVSPATAKAVGVKAETTELQIAEPMECAGPKTIAAKTAIFPTFTIGDETIKNAKLTISDLFRKYTGGYSVRQPDMLLGADFLRSHRVYIARHQEMIYFSYEGGPVFRQKPIEKEGLPVAGDPVAPAPPP